MNGRDQSEGRKRGKLAARRAGRERCTREPSRMPAASRAVELSSAGVASGKKADVGVGDAVCAGGGVPVFILCVLVCT